MTASRLPAAVALTWLLIYAGAIAAGLFWLFGLWLK